jgi:hypothetical protein
MPFKDKWGNDLFLDTQYIFPFGGLGEKWGQSAIPLGDFMPSNPLFQVGAAVLTNKDAFTGRPIYNEILDSNARIVEKYLDYAWKEISPSNPLVPGTHSFNKVKTGVENTLLGKDVRDWADRPIELQTALMSTLLGIKLSPSNERKLREFQMREIKKIKREIGMEKGRIKGRQRKGELNSKESMDEIQKLNELNKRLLMEKLER